MTLKGSSTENNGNGTLHINLQTKKTTNPAAPGKRTRDSSHHRQPTLITVRRGKWHREVRGQHQTKTANMQTRGFEV